jgi:hypothetical protein
VLFGILKKVVPSFIFQRFLYFLLPGSLKWGGLWKAKAKAEIVKRKIKIRVKNRIKHNIKNLLHILWWRKRGSL